MARNDSNPDIERNPIKPLPESETTRVNPNSRSGETVTVACKLSMGLVMHLDEMIDRIEPLFGGGYHTVKVAQKMVDDNGEPITYRLNPARVPVGMTEPPAWLIAGGYSLTPGIPKDFWDRWAEQNKPLVSKGFVFAASSTERAQARANEQRGLRTGLEPLDPSNLPTRGQAAKIGHLGKVETSERPKNTAA